MPAGRPVRSPPSGCDRRSRFVSMSRNVPLVFGSRMILLGHVERGRITVGYLAQGVLWFGLGVGVEREETLLYAHQSLTRVPRPRGAIGRALGRHLRSPSLATMAR